MTDGDSKRLAAQSAARQASASERQAEVAEKREKRERSHVPFKDIAGGVGSLIKGLKNHPSWYTNYPGGDYFGKLSFERPAGRASEKGTVWNGGFQTIGYLPSIGTGQTLSKDFMPAYRALLRMQQEVRLANAGAKNYEPSDIAIYAFATGEILAAYAELARAYSLINSHDPRNVWKRELAIKVLIGQDYSVVAKNGQLILSTLRAAYSAMQTVALPHIPYFDRVWHLAFNLFNDNRSTRSNVIGFVRDGFGDLLNAGYTSAQTSALVRMRPIERPDMNAGLPNSLAGSVSDRCIWLMDMIDQLTNSTDYITIMGDLAKAYGLTFDIPKIEDDIEPCFLDDDITLTQIDNTILVGSPVWLEQKTGYAPYSLYDITDMGGFLVQGMLGQNVPLLPPLFRQKAGLGNLADTPLNYVPEAVPIDAPNDNPSPEDVFVLTRNSLFYKDEDIGIASNLTAAILPNGTVLTLNAPDAYTTLTDSNLCGYSDWDVDEATAFDDIYQVRTFVPTTDSQPAPKFVRPIVSGTEYFTASRFYQVTCTGTWNVSLISTSFMSTYDNPSYSVLCLRSYAGYYHAPALITFDDGEQVQLASNVSPIFNAVEITLDFLKSIHYAAIFSEFTVTSGRMGGQHSRNEKRKR